MYALSGCYAFVGLLALLFFFRILYRVPSCGWSVQRCFLVLVVVLSGFRLAFFLLVPRITSESFLVKNFDGPLYSLLEGFGSVLFFCIASLLLYLWSMVFFRQVDGYVMERGLVQPLLLYSNFAVLLTQLILWVVGLLLANNLEAASLAENIFLAVVFIGFALLCMLYGLRLFVLLRGMTFDVRDLRRQRKLFEVSFFSVVWFFCLLFRGIFHLYVVIFDDILHTSPFVVEFYFFFDILTLVIGLIVFRHAPPAGIVPKWLESLNEDDLLYISAAQVHGQSTSLSVSDVQPFGRDDRSFRSYWSESDIEDRTKI